MATPNKILRKGLHVGQVFQTTRLAVFHPSIAKDTCLIEAFTAPQGKMYVSVVLGLDTPTFLSKNTFESNWSDEQTEKVMNDLGWFKRGDQFQTI